MIKNIVFSGGGFNCWAYIGCLRALEEHRSVFDIEQIIGVSAGSSFGLCYLLGIKWDFLLGFFLNLNFKELYDIDIDNILIQQSLFAGKKFTELIKEIFRYRIDPDITFKELKYYSKIKFTVNALNITNGILDYFNYDLTPDVKVIDAIRASCSLPVIFPPYQIGNCFYYDGAICNNCPIELLDEIDSIAFDVSFSSNNNNSTMKLIDLLNCLVTLVSKKKQINENIYSLLDDTFKNESVNLNQ